MALKFTVKLELTPRELQLLKTFVDFHEDDEPDEHYQYADYMSLGSKVDVALDQVEAVERYQTIFLSNSNNEGIDGAL